MCGSTVRILTSEGGRDPHRDVDRRALRRSAPSTAAPAPVRAAWQTITRHIDSTVAAARLGRAA